MRVNEEQMDMLRVCLNKVYDVCDELAADGTSVEIQGTKLSVRQLFEIEATAYMLYLTVSDSLIDEEEVETINRIMGRTYSLDDCVKMVDEFGMRDSEFGKGTPVSFKLLSDYTRANGADIADTLTAFYDALGTALVTADDEMALREAEAHRSFIHLLRGYSALTEAED